MCVYIFYFLTLCSLLSFLSPTTSGLRHPKSRVPSSVPINHSERELESLNCFTNVWWTKRERETDLRRRKSSRHYHLNSLVASSCLFYMIQHFTATRSNYYLQTQQLFTLCSFIQDIKFVVRHIMYSNRTTDYTRSHLKAQESPKNAFRIPAKLTSGMLRKKVINIQTLRWNIRTPIVIRYSEWNILFKKEGVWTKFIDAVKS